MVNSKLWICYKREMLIMNKVFFVGQYIFLSLIFNIISFTFITGDKDAGDIGLILPIAFIPLIILTSSYLFIKADVDDGNMTILLTTLEPYYIILSKFMALVSIAIIASLGIFPISAIIYTYTSAKFLSIIIAQIFLIIQTSAFAILMSSIISYFKNNTHFLITLILPLLIPSIIINGILLKNFEIDIMLASLGLLLIMVPICLLFSNYLLKNVYNY